MANFDPSLNTAQPTPPPQVEERPRPRVKFKHYIEAGFAYAFMGGLKLLSWRMASGVGGWLSRTLGSISKPWKTATRNMAKAFPDMPASERNANVRAAFDNFGRVMAEYAQLPRLWGSRWDGLIDVQGPTGLQWAVANKPAIVFSAHIGNWEIIPMVLAHHGKPAMLVYRAPNNPLVDDLILKIRSQYAAGMAPKGADGLRDIVKHLQNGGTVLMLIDQKTNTGPEIPFFGRGAHTGKAIARIAMRYGCKLIPARSERVGKASFRITFEAPWSVEGNANDENHVRQTLTKLNAKIEDWVRETPGQWMWMHKRWPD
jgi:KDO2-lipid IV(A) lauroyltransferase